MKTINEDIDIFNNLKSAQKYFDKCQSADLLYAEGSKAYFVDKSKTAMQEWPKLYTLVETK